LRWIPSALTSVSRGKAVEERGDDPEARKPTGVPTADERETLRVALQKGYLGVPRATTLVEVADELGRTDVEVAQQLRRGTGNDRAHARSGHLERDSR
jgi:predicted DNA binding protein